VKFDFTGDVQVFTVPDGVHRITVTLAGASGGSASFNAATGAGGLGAKITSAVDVNPGDVFHIYVGGAGAIFGGGYNGGGVATGDNPSFTAGGGGGTDFRAYPYGIDDRMIVAGGGGGASGNCPSPGGHGGYPNGLPSPRQCSNYPVPTGGSQQSGGRLGDNIGVYYGGSGANNGDFFYGGKSVAGRAVAGVATGYGGGGGGGYYGGGGGYASGGGGGSSYSAYPILETVNGTWYGNGTAFIGYAAVGAVTSAPTDDPTTFPTA